MNTIDVWTLREWLEQGKPVTVVDVRTDADYAEWRIPGSVHINAYDNLKAQDPRALAGLALPSGTPVVTVCGAGKVSMTAAGQLAARGVEVYSLVGGMKAWSLAWNCAEVTAPTDSTILQVRRTGKGCLSYLILSGGEAAVIDPSLPAEVYRELAGENGALVTHVLETHIHADHLSRARHLAEAAGVQLMLPANDRVAFPFTPVAHGDTIRIGAARLRALHTPGHTWESTSYVLDDAAVFTGDTLFLSSVGRPDLHAFGEEGRAKARALHASLQQLRRLPPATGVLPGRTSEPIPFDSAPVSASLGEVVERTPLLELDEQMFVTALLDRIGAPPPYYAQIVDLNEQGILPNGDPTDLEAGANRCAVA